MGLFVPPHPMAESKLRPAVFSKLSDLEPISSGVNLKVKVLSSKLVVEKRNLQIAECLVGDETGCMLFSARNGRWPGLSSGFVVLISSNSPSLAEQIKVAQPNSHIILRNCKVIMFKGFMRLSVDMWGLVQPNPDPSATEVTVNESENFSNTEYELV